MLDEGDRPQAAGDGKKTFRARYAFPIDAPPIADAALTIDGPRIVTIGRWSASTATNGSHIVDLGSAAILPGFANAHTHLEFSDLPAPLGRAGISFADWIRAVVAYRRSRSDSDRREAVRRGLEESARAGTSVLGEIATPGWPVDLFARGEAIADFVSTTVFLELLGLSIERTAANILAATEHAQLESPSIGLSPHSPYTVRPELVRHAAKVSRSAKLPLAMHLAESPEEMQLLQSGDGPIHELLQDFGAWDAQAIPIGARPLDYLRMLADAERSLVIHGTYLDDDEIAYLAARSDRMAVVYCPRTHAYFPHAPYPLAKLLAAGVTVAMGTDSRASNPDLSLFEEFRFAAANHSLPPEQILAAATLGGAKALGCGQRVGTLTLGKIADVAIVDLPNVEAEPYELLLDPRSSVIATIRAGKQIARNAKNTLGRVR